MSELDPRSEDALAQLRASWEPPVGVEDRLLAAIHARISRVSIWARGARPWLSPLYSVMKAMKSTTSRR